MVERRLGRKGHVEHGEERYKPRINIVASATRLSHGSHVVYVLHRLPVQVLAPVHLLNTPKINQSINVIFLTWSKQQSPVMQSHRVYNIYPCKTK